MERKAKLILTALLFVGAVVSSYFAIETYANYTLEKKFANRLSKLPLYASYRKFHYNLLKNDVEIDDLTFKDNRTYICVGKLYIDLPFTARKKEVPQAFSVKAEDLELPSDFPGFRELLRFVGYRNPFVTVNFVSSYSFKGNRIEVASTAVARRLGGINLELKLEGIDRKLTQEFLEGRIPVRYIEEKGALKEFELTYKDFGLFQQFLSFVGSQEGQKPDKVKEELKRSIVQAIKKRGEIAERVGLPLLLFVDNPDCLKVEVKPPFPIKISQLVDMASKRPKVEEIIKTLNLRLTTCN